MLRLILFDLDGTLADTAPDIANAVNLALTEQQLGPINLSDIRGKISNGSRAVLQAALPHHVSQNEKLITSLITRMFHHYANSEMAETRFFPGVREMIAGFPDKGLRWGVVSNKPEKLAKATLKALAPSPAPECIIGGDTYDHSKPHPAPLLSACATLKVNPEDTLYVGDAEIDVVAARAANIRVAIAGFGYAPKAALVDAWLPDFYATNVAELEELIRLDRLSVSSV